MEWTRLFDEKLRLINKQLYTIVEASRIIAHHLTFSLFLSFILFFSLSRFFPCSRSRNGEAAWLQINLTLYKYVQCNVRHRRASLLHMYIYSTNSKRNLGRLLARSFVRNSGGRGGESHVNHAPLSSNMTHALLPSLFHIPPPENSNWRFFH